MALLFFARCFWPARAAWWLATSELGVLERIETHIARPTKSLREPSSGIELTTPNRKDAILVLYLDPRASSFRSRCDGVV